MPSLITYNSRNVLNNNIYATPMDVGSYAVLNHSFQLNNLPVEKRKSGMMVYILENNSFYILKDVDWNFTFSDWQPLSIDNKDEKSFLDKEVPTGISDGVNREFILSQIPLENSEHVYLNGALQDPGIENDYTIFGNVITFKNPPYLGSKVRCTYRLVEKISPELQISDKEIPEGVADGFNKIFLLKNYPEINSEHVYVNGLLQDDSQDYDYEIINNQIIFKYPPLKDSKIKCTYRFF